MEILEYFDYTLKLIPQSWNISATLGRAGRAFFHVCLLHSTALWAACCFCYKLSIFYVGLLANTLVIMVVLFGCNCIGVINFASWVCGNAVIFHFQIWHLILKGIFSLGFNVFNNLEIMWFFGQMFLPRIHKSQNHESAIKQH